MGSGDRHEWVGDGVTRRTWISILWAVTITVGVVAGAFAVDGSFSDHDGRASSTRTDHPRTAGSHRPATTAPLPPSSATTLPAPPSSVTTLRSARTITGQLSPKSVVASGTGIVFAQNMIYEHTVTVYDRDGNLVKTIPDTVDLTALGISGHPGPVKGGPVEAAFSPDAKHAYVSNYSMYGPGFGHPGSDTCSPASHVDPSFVYRIDVATLAIDAAIPVGSVPKYVAVTPDGHYLLVSNWCSYDLSVIDTATDQEVKRIPLGPYPRGIAVDPTSSRAYVAVMGTRDVATIDLATFAVTWIRNVGSAPRHAVMDPAGSFLYVTLNASGQVAKIALGTGAVVARVSTGSEPRSMAIAPDGQAIYVVNYGSATVTKLRTVDLHPLQTIRTNQHPIGITYEPVSRRVWVACYSGAILVLDDGA